MDISPICKTCGTVRVAVHRKDRKAPRLVCRPCENARLRRHVVAKGRKNRGTTPEQVAAHKAVYSRVKSGKLVRQPCRDCGGANVQAHHADYARPLDVVWLCARCHKAEHRRMMSAA